jgi:HEAT repeat protein
VRPQTRFDGYAAETYVGMDYQIGWPRLSKGRHTVTFVCLGKNAASSGYNLGVDDLILARTGEAGWAKAAQVKAPVVPESVSGLAAALSNPDPVIRGLAALELKNRGAAAAPALPSLIVALKDPDVIVRMTSASAIGSVGPKASAAVPALIAACRVENEVTHVLRACAAALVDIGPAAAPALPALRELIAKKPLVRRSAERAIEQIESARK